MSTSAAEVFSDRVFLGWFLGLFAAYALGRLVLPYVSYFKDKPVDAAHDASALIFAIYVAVLGLKHWFFDPNWIEVSWADKCYGNFPMGRHLATVMLAGQCWDFISSCASKALRRPEHIAHHLCAGILAYSSLSAGTYGFLLYYWPAITLTEVSTIPLMFVDMFRRSKQLQESFKLFNEVNRPMFAISFLAIRVVYWPFVTFDFYRSTLYVFHRDQTYHTSLILLAYWWVANTSLTLLQWYWGSLVVKGIIKLLRGNKSSDGEDGYKEPAEAREPLAEALLEA